MYHFSNVYFKAKPHELLPWHLRLRKQAKMIGLSSKALERLEWIIFYYTMGGQNVTKVSSHFGIDRSTVYYWLNRFDETNLKTLESRSTVPSGKRSWQPDGEILVRMLKLRKSYPRWGKMKLKYVYQYLYDTDISSWQFQKLIEVFKLQRIKRRNPYRSNGGKRTRVRITDEIRKSSKELLQLDTIVLHLFGTKRYILTAVDHQTKLAYARIYNRHNSQSSCDFLIRLRYLLDDNISIILTDNGSEFEKYFKQAIDSLKIKRYYTKPRTPKDNPECERFNRTLKEEWLSLGNWFESIEEMNQSLTDWLIIYNSIRPHQSLNYLTPLQYATKTKHLSESFPSSTSD